MGSFKIWINGLWKDNIADKFDELKDAIPDFKDVISNPIVNTINDLKNAIPDIKTILTNPLNTKLEELKNAIPDLKTEITEDITSKLNELKIDMPDLNGIFTDVLKKTIEDYKKDLPSIDDLGTKITEPLSEKLHEGIIGVMDELASKSKQIFLAPLMPLLDRDGMPSEVKKAISGINEHEGELGSAILDISVGFYISNLLSTLSQPAFNMLSQEIYQAVGGENPPIPDAVAMKNRNIITQAQLDNIIQENGFRGEWTQHIQDVYKFHPAATDIIRFMIRDVFDEEACKKYKYDTDFSLKTKDATKWIKGAGVDLETLKLYWRSHWELPSPTMLFEMLHRKVLTENEVVEALQLADYAPASIPKMMKVSYHPLTRVDVGRMWKTGTITNVEELISSYQDVGYNYENASKMADFIQASTSVTKTKKERDLTKTEVLNGYIFGEISKEEGKSFLKTLGYDDEESEFILVIKEIKEERKLETKLINVIKKEYSKEITTYQAAITELEGMGLTQKRLGIIKREMDILKRNMEADK